MPRIAIKRIYEPAADDDGCRVLVDRLWPRGVSKQEMLSPGGQPPKVASCGA